MKLCKECKWMREPGEFAQCVAPKNMLNDYTGFGNHVPRFKYCSSHRIGGGLFPYLERGCGKQGRWFELLEKPKTGGKPIKKFQLVEER